MKTKEEILSLQLGRYALKPADIYHGTNAIPVAINRSMDEYAQQFNQWTTVKPDFKEECVLVTATKIREHWEYSSWIIKKVECDGSWYMGWLTGEGEEYGDLADLTADKYLILPKHD